MGLAFLKFHSHSLARSGKFDSRELKRGSALEQSDVGAERFAWLKHGLKATSSQRARLFLSLSCIFFCVCSADLFWLFSRYKGWRRIRGDGNCWSLRNSSTPHRFRRWQIVHDHGYFALGERTQLSSMMASHWSSFGPTRSLSSLSTSFFAANEASIARWALGSSSRSPGTAQVAPVESSRSGRHRVFDLPES